MRRIGLTGLAIVLIVMLGGVSCSDNERLADYAQNSVDQQNRQNEQIAKQNLENTQQNRQVAEAAQKLVEADARARQEMVTAHRNLHEKMQAERAHLDQQREKLEQERRELADIRHRDPLIAEAISGFGLILACIVPLLIGLYVLRHLHTDRGDEATLNELLVTELAAEEPLLLPRTEERLPAIEHEPPPEEPADA